MAAHTVIERHRHSKFPRLSLELRSSSRFWQGLAFVGGRTQQKSTGHHELRTAFRMAEGWYRGLLRATRTTTDPIATRDDTMGELFQRYAGTLGTPQRAEADKRWSPIKSFWATIRQDEVGSKTFHEFYRWRRGRNSKLSNHTVHKDVVLVRQLLRYAAEHGLREVMPIVPRFGRIARNPRPWLTPDEWRHLQAVSLTRIGEVADNPRLHRQRQDLHDFMLFMVGTMMRVGEARGVHVQHCTSVPADFHPRLLVEVRGKTGWRTIVGKVDALIVFENRAATRKPEDPLFEHGQRDSFRELLTAAGLRTDAFGTTRNLKSLRATAISLFILDNPKLNLRVVASNAGTSLAMIDTFYAKRLTAEMHVEELGGV